MGFWFTTYRWCSVLYLADAMLLSKWNPFIPTWHKTTKSIKKRGRKNNIILEISETTAFYASLPCHFKLWFSDTSPFSLSLSFFPEGFAGELCDYEYNECESNPCLNDGECIDQIGGYDCKCSKGYLGNRCQMKVSSRVDKSWHHNILNGFRV